MTTDSNNEDLYYCRVCKQHMPLKRFYTDKTTSGIKPRSKCKTCTQATARENGSSNYRAFLTKLHASSKHVRVKAGFTWEINVQDLIDLWEAQNGRCEATGLVMTHHRDGSGHKDFNASVDRINPRIGYTVDNIRLVCYAVNIMKKKMDEGEFYFWIKSVYEKSCD
jgi:hypothetical protein